MWTSILKITAGLVTLCVAVLQMFNRKQVEDAARLDERAKETEKNEHDIAIAITARQDAYAASSNVTSGSLPDDGFRRD
jgi:predicted cobalt transporter CbtA